MIISFSKEDSLDAGLVVSTVPNGTPMKIRATQALLDEHERIYGVTNKDLEQELDNLKGFKSVASVDDRTGSFEVKEVGSNYHVECYAWGSTHGILMSWLIKNDIAFKEIS